MEKTFASFKRIAALMMIAVTVVSCQKAPESAAIRGGGTSPRSNGEAGGTSTTQSGLTLNGFVWSNDQAFFLEMVQDFMAGSLDPQYVGFVSATVENNTGVFFGGRVKFTGNQTLQTVNGAQLDGSSELIVSVFDYVPNQSPAPLPPTYFKQLDIGKSYVNGNQAKLVFYDPRGFVEMNGQLDSEYFTGTFYFDTTVRWDGQQGGAGQLGLFKVPKCQFFRCN
ncbi:MAG: hypothetical protein AAB250_04120 [Bdellovibrionota bacterium]